MEGAPPAEELAAIEPEPPLGGIGDLLDVSTPHTGWWGIYDLSKKRFVGSGVDWRKAWGDAGFGAIEDAEVASRDEACLDAAREQLPPRRPGYIFLPLGFSSLIKPSVRESYRSHYRSHFRVACARAWPRASMTCRASRRTARSPKSATPSPPTSR